MPDDFKPTDFINDSGIRFTVYTQAEFNEATRRKYSPAPDLDLKQSGPEQTIIHKKSPELIGGRGKESDPK